jgi:rhamnosyltransferase subunit B
LTASSRKILVVTFGSLGDLHPFVALAHALAAEGLTPVIATSAAYADYIASEGLLFTPIRPDGDDLVERLGIEMGEIARRMANDDRFLFQQIIFPHLRENYDDVFAASADACAIVSHSIAFSARLAAEKRGLPGITTLLSPVMLFSPDDPPLGSLLPFWRPPQGRAGRNYNRALLWALAQAIGLWARPLRLLRRQLGLPPRRGLDLLLGLDSSAAMIGLFSPLLSPTSSHWEKLDIVGHTFHDRFVSSSVLDPEIEAFLAVGAPPLVFTLGSFVARQRDDLYRQVAEAAQRLGRRALLLADEADIENMRATIAGDVYVAAYAPHSLIFPRACAILHHGGAGTTGQALRAGRPQLVIPFLGDQFDNAQRLVRLGVARTLQKMEVTAETLTGEIAALIDDAKVAARAQDCASQIRNENGAVIAARRIAALLDGNVPMGSQS